MEPRTRDLVGVAALVLVLVALVVLIVAAAIPPDGRTSVRPPDGDRPKSCPRHHTWRSYAVYADGDRRDRSCRGRDRFGAVGTTARHGALVLVVGLFLVLLVLSGGAG